MSVILESIQHYDDRGPYLNPSDHPYEREDEEEDDPDEAYERERQMNKQIDWVSKCSKKYFRLTGQSPEQSFWNFIAECSMEENLNAFKILYKELDDYFPKD